ADRVPELLVFNKCDANHEAAKRLVYDNPGSVAISAATGEGIDDLLRTIGDRVRSLTAVVELLVPYERGDVMASLHREGEVVSTSHEDGGIRVRARLADAARGRLTEFVVQ
ncbi:MAG: GTPase HflX, partial [Ilumatobacteraceae bacterium]